MNHQVPPTAVNCPPPPPDPLDYSHQSTVRLCSLCGELQTSYKYQQHLTESSCCCCHTAKFGPCVQSLRLPVNQLNQQSLIPAGQDRFIKGLISASSCFSQPNHFPRSRVTQRQEYEIFPHPPGEHQRTSHAQIGSTL